MGDIIPCKVRKNNTSLIMNICPTLKQLLENEFSEKLESGDLLRTEFHGIIKKEVKNKNGKL